jgi:tRNA-(ms[2]io[6]A)-hydroxylase
VADTKRRLPVLNTGGDNEEDERPPWHWAGFGALLIFGAWLPLAYAASLIEAPLLARFSDSSSPAAVAESIREAAPHDVARLQMAVLALFVVPLAIGAFAGGFVVGRWSRSAGPREAALAGLAATLVTCVLSWMEEGISAAPMAGVAVGLPLAALGGWLGARRRRAAGVAA